MKLEDYIHFHIGCQGIADVTRYHSGKGKHYPLNAVPVVFDSINRNDAQWLGITYPKDTGLQFFDCFDQLARTYSDFIHPEHFTPILRPLVKGSDITEAEIHDVHDNVLSNAEEREHIETYSLAYKQNFFMLAMSNWELRPELFRWLLSKRFDVFKPIDAGLAIAPENKEAPSSKTSA